MEYARFIELTIKYGMQKTKRVPHGFAKKVYIFQRCVRHSDVVFLMNFSKYYNSAGENLSFS